MSNIDELPVFDHTEQLTADDFSQAPYNFVLVANAELDNDVHLTGKKIGQRKRKTEIKFEAVVDAATYKDRTEWVYMICFDHYVVKIGGTYTGLKGRMSSYLCGTQEYRDAGTCATTNYILYQSIMRHLREGGTVQLYATPVPQQTLQVDVWGTPMPIRSKTFQVYEERMLTVYKSLFGTYPPLSQKSGNDHLNQ